MVAGILFASCPLYSRSDRAADISTDSLQQSYNLKEVVVKGENRIGRDEMGRMSLTGTEINRRPALFGERDLIKVLQTTSGVVSGTEGFAGLYVRGGETDQNLYLLDGLPLLNVYHFGGLFSTFSSHSINKVDFYKGAFPSYFGERASSIVDVASKRPNYEKITGIASVGLISGQIYFSTPVKKGNSAVAVALRRTWFDALSIPAMAIVNATKKDEGTKKIFNYNFTDMLMKFSMTDRSQNELSLVAFYGKDNFRLGEERFYTDEEKMTYRKDENKMLWGNWGVSIAYKLSIKAGDLHLQTYVSKAFSMDSEENMDDTGDKGRLTTKTEVCPAVLQAGIRETLSFPMTKGLKGEAGLQQTWYDYRVGHPMTSYIGINEVPAGRKLKDYSNSVFLSAFGELSWNAGDIVEGSAGLRANYYLSEERKHLNLEPRMSVKILLPRKQSVSVGYARVSQYAQQVSSNYMYLPSDAWLPTASYQRPLLCDIYSVGYFRDIENDYSVKAEVWLKDMRNMADYKPGMSVTTTTLPWHEKLTFGKGLAYGFDIETECRYRSVSWNMAYGLMWNWRKFPDLNSGKRYPAKFDNRHKLDIGLTWKINGRFELSGQWEYMTGNRVTLALYNIAPPNNGFPNAPFLNPVDPGGKRNDGIDYYDRRNNVRLPAFHRLNLNLSVKGRLGKKLNYQWDFGLYNAYCRMNAFTVVKDYVNENMSNKGDYREFKTLSLLPILPSVSYTLSF